MPLPIFIIVNLYYEVISMYKEDVIYEKWKLQITAVNNKFFRSKKKKRYINRPYFEKDTVVDDSIVDFNELRKNLEDQLVSEFIKFTSLFVSDSITVLDIEPLYQPYIFNGTEVYDIKSISPIKTIDFCTPMSYNSCSDRMDLLTAATKIPRASFDKLQYIMTKALINSYYGFSTTSYFMVKTRICIVVNKAWKIFMELSAPEEYVLKMIVSLYTSGITSFDSLANIKYTECAKEEIIYYMRYDDHNSKLFDDILNYPKPSRFRVEMFKTLTGSSDYYNLESHYIANSFHHLFTDMNRSIRSNIEGFVRDCTTQLLSAMNKYGDIVDNSENICL